MSLNEFVQLGTGFDAAGRIALLGQSLPVILLQ